MGIGIPAVPKGEPVIFSYSAIFYFVVTESEFFMIREGYRRSRRGTRKWSMFLQPIHHEMVIGMRTLLESINGIPFVSLDAFTVDYGLAQAFDEFFGGGIIHGWLG